MHGVLERSASQVLNTTPPVHHHGQDEEVVLGPRSPGAGSPSGGSMLRATSDLIDNRMNSQVNKIRSTSSVLKQQRAFEPGLPKMCVGTELPQTQLNGKKRKSSTPCLPLPTKKIKVDGGSAQFSQTSGSHQLPPEIWQHIFKFLPPKMLGRLLSVDRCFNSLLDPALKLPYLGRSSFATGSLSTLRPEVIWQYSRRRFWPNMPTPLRDRTELQMWQLACQNRCQSCGSRNCQPISSSGYDPSKFGYIHTGLRPIWPFALTSCEACLADTIIKEVDLLLSPTIPSFLITALPFMFIDNDMHTISSAMVQAGQVTLGSALTKIFLSNHVAAIQEEFASVRRMGEATAEEWVKGLEGRGKENRADSLRWEKFEISGGLMRIRQRMSSQPSDVMGESKKASKPSGTSNFSFAVKKRGKPIEVPERSVSFPTGSAPVSPPSVQPVSETQVHEEAVDLHSKRRERAEEMKTARRAEIERRAMELEPPLPAHVLASIPAFQAAILISSPLSDTAWSILKPRLIAQREIVAREPQLNQRIAGNPQTIPRKPDPITIQNKQQINKDWDTAQTSLRAKLSALADEIIRDEWKKGQKVNKESSPQFAADVLLYSRRRFYAEIDKEDATARASGQSPISDAQNGPYTRRLTLENMKWLFEVKVKPFTEAHGKELFYCHGCKNNTKLYGFEGVVQHYSAKHTSSLSFGSVVVHWRTEWPKVPPFHPQPRKLKNQRPSNLALESSVAFRAVPATSHESPFYQAAVHPNYGQTMPHSQYDVVPIQPPYVQGPFMTTPTEYTSNYFQDQARHPPSNLPLSETVYQGPPECPPGAGLYAPVDAVDLNSHPNIPYQVHPISEFQPYHQPQLPKAHHKKLEEITRNSINLWRSISPAKELPKAVRVSIVIYHVFTKFQKRFSEAPPLGLFMHGVLNNKEMRPMRNVNGLRCKVCQLGSGITVATVPTKKSYSLLQLVEHFLRHIEQPYATGTPMLNWHTDMIHVPDTSMLSNPGSLNRLDKRIRTLINKAFSGFAFDKLRPDLIQGSEKKLSLDREAVDRSGCHPPAYASKQQLSLQQPHIQHPETMTVQDTNQHDIKTHSMRRNMAKGSRSATTQLNDRASMNAETFNIEERAIVSSAQFSLPGSNDGELQNSVEADGGEDEFDLIAGLESQLDQQASSVRRDTPLGPKP